MAVDIGDVLSRYSSVSRKAKIQTRSRSGKIDDTEMSREKRKYELKKRADDMAETHLRITEAAIELHGTVGPARTTLSAVAKRAGRRAPDAVPPLPDRGRAVRGVLAHYFAAHPWPDLDGWRAIAIPERLERALDELYAYYERTAPMLAQRAARRRARRFRTRRGRAAARVPRGGRGGPRRTGRRGRPAARPRCATRWRSRPGARSNGVKRADAVKLVTALVERAG